MSDSTLIFGDGSFEEQVGPVLSLYVSQDLTLASY